MQDATVAGNVIPMPAKHETWPNALRESAAIADIARALHTAQRFAVGVPWQDWSEVSTTDRLTYLEAATRALRGVSHDQRALAEFIAAIHVAASHDVDWFSLSASQQMAFLYGARDAITAYERFLKGGSHRLEVVKARQARQLLQARWTQQDRETAAADRVVS